MKKIHIIIRGLVTRVGFRWWLKKEAEKRNVYGFVKNNTKNEVEAVLLGDNKDVDEIIKICSKGPTLSKVENIKIKNYQQEYLKRSFDILGE